METQYSKSFIKKINYLKLRDWVCPIGVISNLNKMVFNEILGKIERDEILEKHDIQFINDIYRIY